MRPRIRSGTSVPAGGRSRGLREAECPVFLKGDIQGGGARRVRVGPRPLGWPHCWGIDG
jgi:hypothetical protein